MATPPPSVVLRKDDFPSTGLGSSEAVERLFTLLNPFLQSTRAALNGGITFGQNSNTELKTVTVKTPTSTTGAFANGYPYAEYYCSTAQSIPNAALTTVNMDTKVLDTDNAVTPGAGWVFTVPAGKGGLYSISSEVDLSTATASGDFYVAIAKNGPEFKRLTRLPLSSVSIRSFAGTYTGIFAAGDTIAIQAFQNSGGAQPLEAGATESNWVAITALNLTTPPVQSCFPLTIKSKVTNPKGIILMAITDTGSGAPVPAPGAVVFVPQANGTIQLTNIPGLCLGRTYTLQLLIVGG